MAEQKRPRRRETFHTDNGQGVHIREEAGTGKVGSGSGNPGGAKGGSSTIKRASAKEPGRESGVCSVCGYTTERELAYTGLNPWLRVTVIGVGGLVALTILVLAVDSARRRSKGRSARAEKPAAYSGRHVKK